MRGYGDAILGLCIAILRDKPLAEDVRQRTFLEVYRQLDTFDVTKTFLPWLRAIARCRCLDEAKATRRRARHFVLGEDLPELADPRRSSEEMLTFERYSAEVHACLGRL